MPLDLVEVERPLVGTGVEIAAWRRASSSTNRAVSAKAEESTVCPTPPRAFASSGDDTRGQPKQHCASVQKVPLLPSLHAAATPVTADEKDEEDGSQN